MGHKEDWFSSAGYRVVWLDTYRLSPGELPVPQLHFYTLASPVADGDYSKTSGYPEFASEGMLDVPVDLQEVTGIDVCDEPGCMVVTADTPNDDVKRIHFFDF